MEPTAIDFKTFLKKRHQPKTIVVYLEVIGQYKNYMGRTRTEQAHYAQVLDYLSYLRQKGQRPSTLNRVLCTLKQYYDWLVAEKKRADNPCRSIRLRDKLTTKDIQLQDLLTEQELHRLLNRIERFPSYALRNQVVMSLLVYQALRSGEMVRLKVGDVNLEKGQIRIKEHLSCRERILKLQAVQILSLHRYINDSRPKLVKQKTEALIISGRGRAENGEGISYLVETFKPMFPTKKLNPIIIRQSVIANLLKKGNDLAMVQAFAGHVKPSSTERYRTNDIEALKQSVNRYHPLK